MLKVEITPIYKDYINALTNKQIANLSKKISRTISYEYIDDNISSLYIDIPDCKNRLFNSWNIVDEILNDKPHIKVITSYKVNDEYKLFEINSETQFERKHGMFKPVNAVEYNGEHIDFIFILVDYFDQYGHFVYNNRINLDNYSYIKLIGMSFFNPIYQIKDIYSNEKKLNECITPVECYDSFN